MRRLVQNDADALIACRTKALQRPGYAQILPTMTMPCLLFAGGDDPIYAENKECTAAMPNVTFFSLPISAMPTPFSAVIWCCRVSHNSWRL
jgi:hypothetical protein